MKESRLNRPFSRLLFTEALSGQIMNKNSRCVCELMGSPSSTLSSRKHGFTSLSLFSLISRQ